MRLEIVTEMNIYITMSSSFGDTQLTNLRRSIVGKLRGPDILQKPIDHYCVHKSYYIRVSWWRRQIWFFSFFFLRKSITPSIAEVNNTSSNSGAYL